MKRIAIHTQVKIVLMCDLCDETFSQIYYDYLFTRKKEVFIPAKEAGWKISEKNQTCLCPDCKNKSLPTPKINRV